MVIGSPKDQDQAFLVIDAKVIMEVRIPMIPLLLMASFFVFDYVILQPVQTFTRLWKLLS